MYCRKNGLISAERVLRHEQQDVYKRQVYCLEEADNGKNLPTVEIPADAVLEEVYEEGLLGGTMTIRTKGTKLDTEAWGRELYQEKRPERIPVELKFIPYCLWDNRGEGEMTVWVRYKDE